MNRDNKSTNRELTADQWLIGSEDVDWPMATLGPSDHIIKSVNPAFSQRVNRFPADLIGQKAESILSVLGVDSSYLGWVTESKKPVALTSSPLSTLAAGSVCTLTPFIVRGEVRSIGVQIMGGETLQKGLVAYNEAMTLGVMRQHAEHDQMLAINERLEREVGDEKQTTGRLMEEARLLDISKDAILLIDADGTVRSWNQGAEHLYGWSQVEAIGKKYRELIDMQFADTMEDLKSNLERDGQVAGEVTQTTRTGKHLFAYFRWVKDPRSQSVLTSYTDITERKAAETAVAQARDNAVAATKAKDEFLAALSHELRTPLTPILLMAELSSADGSLSERTRKTFSDIARNATLEARLVDDLLDVTRITHGKLALTLSSIDPNAVLRDAINIVHSEFVSKEIDLNVDLSPRLTQIRGDAVRLQQVFWNLLRNAVKFSPQRGSSVFVRSEIVNEKMIRVSIRDQGIGMTQEELGRLFRPFSQGDHAGAQGSHRFGGLGLGLAISRALIDHHAGTIRVESPGLDQGSTFIVELPLEENPANFLASSPRTPTATSLPPTSLSLKILLVEDHDSTRRALHMILAEKKYEVVSVASVAQALTAASKSPFNLLISDVGLPDGTGYQLLQQLRQAYGLQGIALTGYGRAEDIARSVEAGFITHLIKPISVENLGAAILRFQQLRQSQ